MPLSDWGASAMQGIFISYRRDDSAADMTTYRDQIRTCTDQAFLNTTALPVTDPQESVNPFQQWGFWLVLRLPAEFERFEHRQN